MRFIIRGEKLEVTDAIKSYVEEKINKLEKYYDAPENVEAKILLKVKGSNQTIEVMLTTPSFILRGEVSHSDLYAAIDLVVDKLENQIRKNKNKIKSKMNREKIAEFGYFHFEEEFEDEEETKIVKRKNLDLKPMSEEEAILQMELLGHNFFVFKNIDTESICVLYKRKDDNYGIIDTK